MLIVGGLLLCLVALAIMVWMLRGSTPAAATVAPDAKRAAGAKPPPGATNATKEKQPSPKSAAPRPALAPTPTAPRLYVEDDEEELTRVAPSSVRASGDGPAELTRPAIELKNVGVELHDEPPTGPLPLILVVAAGQSDRGQKRRNNEDRYLLLPEHEVFAVADGMGGHEHGDVASSLAVETLERAFRSDHFTTKANPDIPRRADELARAVQMANAAVRAASATRAEMGTTLVALRFALNKKRAYIAHVGDSRCYRLRSGVLKQLTTDHTFGNVGAEGPVAGLLSRAIGIDRKVPIDLLLEEPSANDLYLLCTDGLTKMVDDDGVRAILRANVDLQKAADSLIDEANARGGRDNITVVLVRVQAA